MLRAIQTHVHSGGPNLVCWQWLITRLQVLKDVPPSKPLRGTQVNIKFPPPFIVLAESIEDACEPVCVDIEVPFLIFVEREHVHGVDVVHVQQLFVVVIMVLKLLWLLR